jgi:CDP-glycerol glycerophosphotransferase (TagB/SpsB family)
MHCGYPRNDVLRYDDVEIINTDEKLLEEMKNNSTIKYVVYMPTWRPLGFEKNPIDYIELNEFGKKHNIKFIIKMHPFVAEAIQDDLNLHQPIKDYTNLCIFASHKDIYPILKHSHMLVSDYSSVYFDYLFVDKPILFFPYDYEEWKESANGVMLDYFEYSPGDKAYNFEELKEMILKNLEIDEYKQDRYVILDKMFENKNEKSSKLIANKLIKYMETDSG